MLKMGLKQYAPFRKQVSCTLKTVSRLIYNIGFSGISGGQLTAIPKYSGFGISAANSNQRLTTTRSFAISKQGRSGLDEQMAFEELYSGGSDFIETAMTPAAARTLEYKTSRFPDKRYSTRSENRHTRDQVGNIVLYTKIDKTPNTKLFTKNYITDMNNVRSPDVDLHFIWTLPETVWIKPNGQINYNVKLGVFKYGTTLTIDGYEYVRSIDLNNIRNTSQIINGIKYFSNQAIIKSPTFSGQYIIRIYDNLTDKYKSTTFCTSKPFTIKRTDIRDLEHLMNEKKPKQQQRTTVQKLWELRDILDNIVVDSQTTGNSVAATTATTTTTTTTTGVNNSNNSSNNNTTTNKNKITAYHFPPVYQKKLVLQAVDYILDTNQIAMITCEQAYARFTSHKQTLSIAAVNSGDSNSNSVIVGGSDNSNSDSNSSSNINTNDGDSSNNSNNNSNSSDSNSSISGLFNEDITSSQSINEINDILSKTNSNSSSDVSSLLESDNNNINNSNNNTKTAKGTDITAETREFFAQQKEKVDFWRNYEDSKRIQPIVHILLHCILNNNSIKTILPAEIKKQIDFLIAQFYEPVHRFLLHNNNYRNNFLTNNFGYVPDFSNCKISSTIPSSSLSELEVLTREKQLHLLNKGVKEELVMLLPTTDFQTSRVEYKKELFERIKALDANNDKKIISPGATLEIFGSSYNGFGTDNSDLDMNLLLPNSMDDNDAAAIRAKAQAAIQLGKMLKEIGMENVMVRSAARVPVALFVDPKHGLQCDIALGSTLSVHNTQLLHTYSNVDPRVRELGFLVKHWAKNRNINRPSSHTLSSYGYILLVIHFLQNRPVPLLPNLQTLPSFWEGTTPCGFTNVKFDAERADFKRMLTKWDESGQYNVYFYQPQNEEQWALLQNFAAKNKETTAELLIEFFHYFGLQFSMKNDVISIRSGRDKVRSIDKAESDAWWFSDKLKIEDPFETHYDVAHVITNGTNKVIRAELLRAMTLANRLGNVTTSVNEDALPSSVHASDYVDMVCAEKELDF